MWFCRYRSNVRSVACWVTQQLCFNNGIKRQITLLIRAIGKATVQPSVTHAAGRQALPAGALKLPRRAQGRRGGGSAELLVRLVGTVWVAITTQSQVQTWSTAGLGSVHF